jgi:hypothetical protein
VFTPDAALDEVPRKGQNVIGRLSGLQDNPILERPTYIQVTDEFENVPIYGTVAADTWCLNVPWLNCRN